MEIHYYPVNGTWGTTAPPPLGRANNPPIRAINELLAQHRAKAWTYEAQQHKGTQPMFCGASLIKTSDNRYFVSSNVHLKDAEIARDCAEANAITSAGEQIPPSSLQISDVWFMGGKGQIPPSSEPEKAGTDQVAQSILEEEKGKRYAPCGSCRDIILRQGNANTKVHMLPLNDGNWELRESAENTPEEKLEKKDVMTYTIDALFPYVTRILQDTQGALKQSIKGGLEYLNDASKEAFAAIENAQMSGQLISFTEEEAKDIPATINKVMMEKLKSIRQRKDLQGNREVKEVHIAIIRTVNDTYHMGLNLNGEAIQASASASLASLSNCEQQPITDVFAVSVNFDELEKIVDGLKDNPNAAVSLSMPNGDARDRLYKARNSQNIASDFEGDSIFLKKNGPNIHMFTINNIKDFDRKQHMQTYSCAELYPLAFQSPKTQENGR